MVSTSMSVFQFHNGSIKSNPFTNADESKLEFQFHNGSIKSIWSRV